jgi:hypothetical protein
LRGILEFLLFLRHTAEDESFHRRHHEQHGAERGLAMS